jgi:hypothetical protein
MRVHLYRPLPLSLTTSAPVAPSKLFQSPSLASSSIATLFTLLFCIAVRARSFIAGHSEFKFPLLSLYIDPRHNGELNIVYPTNTTG